MTEKISLRETLKQETRELHTSVEAAMGSSFLENRTSYIQRLKDFAALHLSFEKTIAALPEESPLRKFYGKDRHKTSWLAKDLQNLEAQGSLSFLFAKNLFQGWNEDQLWGALYVIEGSTLGGQIISRELKNTLGLTPENGAHFFSSYGESTGARWKEFLAALQSQDSDVEKNRRVLHGARETFRLFETQFNSI